MAKLYHIRKLNQNIVVYKGENHSKEKVNKGFNYFLCFSYSCFRGVRADCIFYVSGCVEFLCKIQLCQGTKTNITKEVGKSG